MQTGDIHTDFLYVHLNLTARMSGSVFMHASDEDPSGPNSKFAQRGCIRNQHFLLPASCSERKCYRRCPLIAGYTGSAEGGRQGKKRRRRRVVEQDKERGLKRCVHIFFFMLHFFLCRNHCGKCSQNDLAKDFHLRCIDFCLSDFFLGGGLILSELSSLAALLNSCLSLSSGSWLLHAS